MEVLVFLLILGGLALPFLPFFVDFGYHVFDETSQASYRLRAFQDEREGLLVALRDLEADLSEGKFSQRDYESLAVETVEQLRVNDGNLAKARRELDGARRSTGHRRDIALEPVGGEVKSTPTGPGSRSEKAFCFNCGHGLERHYNFCPACGQNLSE